MSPEDYDAYRMAVLHSMGISLLQRIEHWLTHPDHEPVVRAYALAVASELAFQEHGTVIAHEAYLTPLWQAVAETRAALAGVLGVGWQEVESAFRQRYPQPLQGRLLPRHDFPYAGGVNAGHTDGVTG